MTKVALTYGTALYSLARDENISSQLLDELSAVKAVFDETPQFTELLSLPSVPKAERCEILDTCFGGRIHEYLLSFLKIFTENGTIREFDDCVDAYHNLYNDDNGILSVTAITAVPLSDELKNRLTARLSDFTGKRIELSVRQNADVLGGVRLEMDGKRYDGTLRSRLDEIQAILNGTVL